MATWHHLNEQLFMPVKALRDIEPDPREMTTKDLTRAGYPSEEKFWERKSDEAYNAGITKSIRKEGMVNPIRLRMSGGEPAVVNGYHRIAAAYDVEPTQFVPVTYKEKVDDPEMASDRLPAHVHREDDEYLD